MFGFLGGPRAADGRIGLPHLIERWDALDVKVEPGVFDRYCYSDYIETNVEAVFDLRGRHYDAVVLIHVLEHLIEPEAAMLRLREAVRKNGIMLGGSPTMPTLLAAMHEPWLRWKYRRILENPLAHRHISVLTPDRILRFARRNHLDIDLLTGTFFCRWSGIVLEDSEWWVRANLLWGAIFPALGGEMYFSLRAH
jgi:2-polyprenyl-3-methyl-5-hydroxy-6-metoxy-1,4-benzoquinol methylase